MVYFVVAALLLRVTLSVPSAFIVVSAALALTVWAFPKAVLLRSKSTYGWNDLWLRMATASFMVVTLTGFAKLPGPMASGILSAFPAYTTILAVFSHRQGGEAALHVLKGVAVGLYTAAGGKPYLRSQERLLGQNPGPARDPTQLASYLTLRTLPHEVALTWVKPTRHS